MIHQSWFGRLFGNRVPFVNLRAIRKPQSTTKLGLNHLPGRDGPSLLSGVEVNLLTGISAGQTIAGLANSLETNVSGVQSSVGKMVRLTVGEVAESDIIPNASSSVATAWNDSNYDPLPTSVSIDNSSISDGIRFIPQGANYSETSRLFESVANTSASLVRNNTGGTVDPSMATAGSPTLAAKTTFESPSNSVEIGKQSAEPESIAPKTPQNATQTFRASLASPGGKFSANASSNSHLAPIVEALESTVSETGDPGTVTETPPIFFDGEDGIHGLKTSQSASPPAETGTSTPQDSSPTVETPGRSTNSAFESSGESTSPPPTSGITSNAETVARPLTASTELFRISGSPETGTSQEVRYTLAAHDANGTISVEGSVTITNSSVPVIITAGPALAGRSPDIITIQLKEMAGARLIKSTGTLFLTPAGERVGDSSLFEAHRMGKSPEAFEQLVQRHSPAVFRACQRIIGNRADAEDVTQFVFLTLAQWQLRFPGTLTGWLHTVARNASYALLRSKSRRQRHEREAAKPEFSEPADSPSMADEGLDSALSQLPAPLEEAVRLRYLEGWSQQEAAQIVGCPRGTLSRRAAHGIETLRELLGAQPATVG